MLFSSLILLNKMNLSKNQDFYSINEPSPYLIHEEKNRGLNENNHDAD